MTLVAYKKSVLLINFSQNLSMTLKVQLCKWYNNECMIASTKITNTEIFAVVAVLVFKLLSRKVLLINKNTQQKLLKSRPLFKEIANFTGKLLQNYK